MIDDQLKEFVFEVNRFLKRIEEANPPIMFPADIAMEMVDLALSLDEIEVGYNLDLDEEVEVER